MTEVLLVTQAWPPARQQAVGKNDQTAADILRRLLVIEPHLSAIHSDVEVWERKRERERGRERNRERVC